MNIQRDSHMRRNEVVHGGPFLHPNALLQQAREALDAFAAFHFGTVIILYAAIEDWQSYDDGVCYVETMNLDGETNLKVKRCLEATLCLNEDEEFRKFKGTIYCEDPNPNLYTYVGNLELENESIGR
ncbi:hypothetical protein FH972_010088 [Carpinus fangiana]|uniref:Uncharacterized protein n=1 Tax=Carpinus fangiana TaxID=176857 RepID=A0A660KM99_9ROSI|nr:hypothetical protein FH972_010088 [Carpinus fangiana]